MERYSWAVPLIQHDHKEDGCSMPGRIAKLIASINYMKEPQKSVETSFLCTMYVS